MDESRCADLQRVQESDQIPLFAGGEADLEPRVVELDDRLEILGRAVVKIGRAPGEPAQDRSLGLAEVAEVTGEDARAGSVNWSVVPSAVRRSV